MCIFVVNMNSLPDFETNVGKTFGVVGKKVFGNNNV